MAFGIGARFEPLAHDGLQRERHGFERRGLAHRLAIDRVTREFFCEKGVAVGALSDVFEHEFRERVSPVDRMVQERERRRPIERRERDRADGAFAHQFAECDEERILRYEFVIANGDDEQKPSRRRTRRENAQRSDEVFVGPVNVFHDCDRRSATREPIECGNDAFEAFARRFERSSGPPLRIEAVEQLVDRAERILRELAAFDATDASRAARDGLRELFDETRLSDARFARDDDEAAA